jgi:hypothetical protein
MMKVNLKNASAKPLPLNDTLRDLALFRASDVDLSLLLPQQRMEPDQPSGRQDGDDLGFWLDRSHEFVREAKAVIRMQNRGLVETNGERVDGVRGELENMLKSLSNVQ